MTTDRSILEIISAAQRLGCSLSHSKYGVVLHSPYGHHFIVNGEPSHTFCINKLQFGPIQLKRVIKQIGETQDCSPKCNECLLNTELFWRE